MCRLLKGLGTVRNRKEKKPAAKHVQLSSRFATSLYFSSCRALQNWHAQSLNKSSSEEDSVQNQTSYNILTYTFPGKTIKNQEEAGVNTWAVRRAWVSVCNETLLWLACSQTQQRDYFLSTAYGHRVGIHLGRTLQIRGVHPSPGFKPWWRS